MFRIRDTIGRCALSSRANPQHNPASAMSRADVLHRLARSLEGELCLDRHPQLAVGSELGDRAQPGGIDRGEEGLELAAVRGWWCSADDEDSAASRADQPEDLVAHLVAGPIEEHVEPARDSVSQLLNEGGVVVVDDDLGAELAEVGVVAGAGDGDDPRPDAPRDLHCGGADATGRGGDEHRLTGPYPGAV